MSKQHYFMKLIPPRATFPGDITPEERELMREHGQYAKDLFNDGKILVYGPVLAAAGAFGIGVFEADDEGEVRQLMEQDPSVRAGLNRYEVHRMSVAGAQGSRERGKR
ncbi:MAG: YciI family protein [Candidatus Acidiferrum sp.]|jgi:uncharacterized protein YciI